MIDFMERFKAVHGEHARIEPAISAEKPMRVDKSVSVPIAPAYVKRCDRCGGTNWGPVGVPIAQGQQAPQAYCVHATG